MEALAPLLRDRRQLEARLSSQAVLPGLPAMFVPLQPGSLKPQGLTRWHRGGSCMDAEFCLLAGQQNNATWSSSSRGEGREIYSRKRLGARKLQQKYWHQQAEGGGGGRQEKESFQEKNVRIRYFQK